MTEQTQHDSVEGRTARPERQRPRWARLIFNVGDDLRWALSAWSNFPRPVGRLAAAGLSAGAAYLFGVDDSIHALFTALAD